MNTKQGAETLSTLIRERDRINAAIAALRALGMGQDEATPVLPRQPARATTPVKRRRKHAPMAKGALSAAVLGYLERNRTTSVSMMTDGIVEFGVNGPRRRRYARLAMTLSYLEKKGKVERVGEGFWRLAPEATVPPAEHTAPVAAPADETFSAIGVL